MLTQTVIDNLKKNSDWQALQKHILSSCEDLKSLEGIDFLDKEKAAIEGQARTIALERLKTILEPFYSGGQQETNKVEETKGRTGLT